MSDTFTTYGPSGMPCMCVPFLSGTPLPVLLFRSDSDCAPLLQRIADAGFIVVVSADLAAALAYVKREVMIADFTVDQGKIAAGACLGSTTRRAASPRLRTRDPDLALPKMA